MQVKYGRVGLSYFTMHFITWPLAILMTLLPLVQVHYGRGGLRDPNFSHHANGIKTGWCDLGGHEKEYFLWKLFSWELELIICFFALVYFAVRIKVTIKAKHAEQLRLARSISSTNTSDSVDGIVKQIVAVNADGTSGDVGTATSTVENPLFTDSASLNVSNSDMTTGSGMDVLKIRMLADTMARPHTYPYHVHATPASSSAMAIIDTTTSAVDAELPSPVSFNPSLTTRFDHSRSQKNVFDVPSTGSNGISNSSKSRARTGSNMSNGLPKQSSSRKTANMISSTLYLYPLCVALTWGPFLVYSLVFEYGELLMGYHGKSLYNNLLFNFLSGLAVQSGSFLTLVFFWKSKYARDEWVKLVRNRLNSWGCCHASSSRKDSLRKWKSVSIMSHSVLDEPGEGHAYEHAYVDESQPGSRSTSACSATNGVNTSVPYAFAAFSSRRNSKRSERPSILSIRENQDDTGVEDSLLDGHDDADVEGHYRVTDSSIDGHVNHKDYRQTPHHQQRHQHHQQGEFHHSTSGHQEIVDDEENLDDGSEDEDDDTLILGRRTESVSASLSDAILASFKY
jgi:hypothetical protein